MNTPTHSRDTVDTRHDGPRSFGAYMKDPTPNRNTPQRDEDEDKALIRVWDQRERDINAILISASAISLSVVWHITNNIRSLEATNRPVYYQELYATALVFMSQRQTQRTTPCPSIPQAPAPSILSQPYLGSELSPSRLLRMNMYWIASLVFTMSTVTLAILSRQRTREVKLGLIRQQAGGEASKSPTMAAGVSLDESFQGFYMSLVIDTMYRLFQVALVVFLLGHIDVIIHPIGVVYLASIVACGTLYIFRVFGPT